MKVALDAGHYRYTPGKRCLKTIDPDETREWVLNSRVAGMLAMRLSDYDCEIMRVDDVTGEHEVTLAERCQAANDWGADIYISIHHNSGISGGAGGGTVVYYCSSDKVRAEQAKALYANVVAETGLVGNRAEPIVKKAYYVLQHTAMPALLLENGFMDSQTDTPVILTYEHAERTAIGLEKFLVELLGLKKIEEQEDVYDKIYNTLEEIPAWGRPTIKKLVEYGYLKGNGRGLDISHEMLRILVILDRAEVF